MSDNDSKENNEIIMDNDPEYKIIDINNDSKVVNVYNFIDNKYVKPCKNNFFENKNPAKNEVISLIPSSTADDVDLAVKSAYDAYKKWKKISVQERSKHLNNLADEIEKRLNEFAILESRDNGKPLSLAKAVDIPRYLSTQVI